MARISAFAYGVVCYALFLYTFLSAIWFVWKMDETAPGGRPLTESILINAALLGVFAIQHSVMARQGFKRMWTKLVPQPIERSTYVLFSSLALLLLMRFWQPIDIVIWDIQNTAVRMVLDGLFWLGWGIVLIATFLINHFDLFGLHQVWLYLRKQPYQPPTFRTPGFYQFVRHPIYMGFTIAFWSTPTMHADHLVFALLTLGYVLVAIKLEERDLVNIHGEQYQVYRSGVSMLVPWPRKRAA